MTNHTLTVVIPEILYGHLRRRAEQAQRPIEDELVLALAASLPVDADLPADLAATLASLVALDDTTLWRLARSRVAPEDAGRLAEAGERRHGPLSGDEAREAEELAACYDRVLVIRAEAAALLKERGHDVTSLRAGA